ncbi:MAG: hypothetical protein AB1758_32270 [Candidatus Eremiobacterota bacterium]
MPKGLFTQGVAVLLSSLPSLDLVQASLARFPLLKRLEPPQELDWRGGRPSLLYDYRPEVNGRVLVSLVDAPWPDLSADDPGAFLAWSEGWLTPLGYPGALERAGLHSPGGADILAGHRAFVRLLLSYSLGEDSPHRPVGCDPVDELDRLLRMARCLVGLPGAVAFFNPGGEILMKPDDLDRLLGLPQLPMDAWANLRVFGAEDDWTVIDSVGMAQLDVVDQEACFPPTLRGAQAAPPPTRKLEGAANFVRNASLYLMRERPIKTGDTLAGWVAIAAREGLALPPRPTLRWFPVDADPPDDRVPGEAADV